ncbi:hypothetical protein ROHU_005969 [Labeo rohita]|uniref:LRR and PYD domains-containing 14-like protein n=1 Tax=Labeo rohita TaxID=84645 RepID=A0A498MX95_LABRO|nr:hypothetical protein ROHU_005969 [Labeo rohita]
MHLPNVVPEHVRGGLETFLMKKEGCPHYKTFPFNEESDDYDAVDQSDFLLDLCSHVKNYDTQTGSSFLPALQPTKETLQQLVECVYEAQEEELTRCFLQKVGNNLTSCSLTWEELRYFLQHKIQQTTVDFRKTNIQCNIREILPFLNRIKFKRVDRLLLLKMLHCCSVSDVQQEAAAVLLIVLQHKLDFTCRSLLDLTTNTDSEPLYLTTDDCRVTSRVIQRARSDTKIQLILHDCEINTAGIYQLFPVLHAVQLCCDKSLLLQFLAHVRPEEAESLSRALGEELDLSQTQLDPQVCRGLVLILEYSEGLTELDLSQCHLTDDSLDLLLPNLHKAQNIDFSDNNITDVGALKIDNIVTLSNNIKTVRLFNNRIEFKPDLIENARLEIW